MRLLYLLTTGLVALVAAAFAVANRQTVTVSFWPLFEPIELPLFIVTLAALVAGLFLGLLIAWIWSLRARRQARERARRIERLERELSEARERLRPTTPIVVPQR